MSMSHAWCVARSRDCRNTVFWGLVLMGGRRVSPEKVQVLLGCLAAGMTPSQGGGGVAGFRGPAGPGGFQGSGRLAAKRPGWRPGGGPGAGRAGRAERERAVLGLLAAGASPAGPQRRPACRRDTPTGCARLMLICFYAHND